MKNLIKKLLRESLSDDRTSQYLNDPLYIEGKKIFPNLRVLNVSTQHNPNLKQDRFFKNYSKNKGSFAYHSFKNTVAQHKINKTFEWLKNKGKVDDIVNSISTNSIYFTFNGTPVRISDHPKQTNGINIVIKWDTQAKDIANQIFEPDSITEVLNFNDETMDSYKGESFKRINLMDDDEIVAYADYTVYGDEVNINMIETLVKGKEYGQAIMKYLAKIYGYENLNRSSLTPSGAEMRKKLDKHFNFNYDEYLKSKNKNLKSEVIDNIKNPVIKKFIYDIVNNGYQYGWKENMHTPEFKDLVNNVLPQYDLDANDLADIAGWVVGSKSNDNHPDDDVPHGVLKDLSKAFKIN